MREFILYLYEFNAACMRMLFMNVCIFYMATYAHSACLAYLVNKEKYKGHAQTEPERAANKCFLVEREARHHLSKR